MTTNIVKAHYIAPELLSWIEGGLAQLGKQPTALTPDDLSPVDEFHVRGLPPLRT